MGEIPTKIKSENSRWYLSADSDCCRSTGPVDRQRLNFRPLGKRSTGPVDRSPKQRVSSLCRSTEKKQRALLLLSVDRSVDRSAHMHNGACWSTDSVDRQSNSTLPAVDRTVDRTRPKVKFLKGLFEDNNFDKNSLDGYIQK